MSEKEDNDKNSPNWGVITLIISLVMLMVSLPSMYRDSFPDGSYGCIIFWICIIVVLILLGMLIVPRIWECFKLNGEKPLESFNNYDRLYLLILSGLLAFFLILLITIGLLEFLPSENIIVSNSLLFATLMSGVTVSTTIVIHYVISPLLQ